VGQVKTYQTKLVWFEIHGTEKSNEMLPTLDNTHSNAMDLANTHASPANLGEQPQDASVPCLKTC
jgi:hypothetical protein